MEYIKEDLETMLRTHLKNQAKLTEIKLKQEEYEERLNHAGTVYQDSKEEAIEGMQLSGKAISDMPISVTNKVSDNVYNTVMNYPKEVNYINREDRDFLKYKIEQCKQETDKLNKIIVRVDNMLQQLSEEEGFVINTYYMKKCTWDYVENAYYEKYGKPKTIKRLQTYRDSALESMLDILNTGA